jgi:AraC-like DNA-binding protein
MKDTMNELRGLVLRHARGRRSESGIPRIMMMRGDSPTGLISGLYEPMICVVLQGVKCIMIGDQVLHYDMASYFVSSIDVPVVGKIGECSQEHPCLSIVLKFDPAVISDVLISMQEAPDLLEPEAAFGISAVTPDLIHAWLRMMRLMETPADIPVLAPLIEREIIYRLLLGPKGGLLRQIATAGSRLSQIRRAVVWIREHLAEPFEVETLAQTAGMSASAFHRHFKAVTAMSPVQYQKRLRLHEARLRLMSEPNDVAHVAFSVGYESATQFNREYARLFGNPPARDAARLRRLESEALTRLDDVA